MNPVFIGDETSAAAWRLAGLDVRIATPAQAAAPWRQALREPRPLVLITAECAAALPPDELDAALVRLDPPVAIVADVADRVAAPDLLPRVRASLGIGGAEESPERA